MLAAATIIGAFLAGLLLGAIVVAAGIGWANEQHARNLYRKSDL